MTILLHLAALAATILLLARFLPGVRIRSSGSAVVVAVTFSILNFFLGWLIRAVVHAVLFVPALFTLGALLLLLPFIVNLILLWITDKLLESFELESLRALLVSAAVITLVNGVFYTPLFQAVAVGHAHYGHVGWL